MLALVGLAALGACEHDTRSYPELPHDHPPEQCSPGATRACYDGPEGSEGVGACRAGSQRCVDSGLGWGPCEDAVLPGVETCDGSDADCDGVASCGETQWVRRYGVGRDEILAQLAVDGSGRSYAIGYYRDPIDVGSGALPAVDASRKLMVASWDANGAGRWSRGLVSQEHATPRGIAASAAGDVIAVGSAAGDIDLDGTAIAGHGGTDALVVAFDAGGALRWYARWGDDQGQHAESVAFDADGNAVVAGMFQGSIDFGDGAIASSDSGLDAFVTKLSPDGQVLWTRVLSGGSDEAPRSVAIDADGRIAVVGYFRASLYAGDDSHSAAGGDDAFVVMLDADGEVSWSRRFGDGASQQAHAVAFDHEGNLVVAGGFAGSVDFGAGPVDADAARAIFVLALDAAGDHRWSRRIGGHSNQDAYDLAIDSLGRIIVSGYYEGTFPYAGKSLAEGGVAEPNLLLLKMTGAGEPLWARGIRVHGNQDADSAWRAARHVAVDPDDALLWSGYIEGPVDFGFGEKDGEGGTDPFLVKLAP